MRTLATESRCGHAPPLAAKRKDETCAFDAKNEERCVAKEQRRPACVAHCDAGRGQRNSSRLKCGCTYAKSYMYALKDSHVRLMQVFFDTLEPRWVDDDASLSGLARSPRLR